MKSTPQPKLYSAVAGDIKVTFLLCRNTLFLQQRVNLNSGATEFLDLAWAEPNNVMLACSNCGYCRSSSRSGSR